MAGATGTTSTSTPNELFDLVSVLYHALEGNVTSNQYIRDAQQSGNQELLQFFQQVQQEDQQRAERARSLLGRLAH